MSHLACRTLGRLAGPYQWHAHCRYARLVLVNRYRYVQAVMGRLHVAFLSTRLYTRMYCSSDCGHPWDPHCLQSRRIAVINTWFVDWSYPHRYGANITCVLLCGVSRLLVPVEHPSGYKTFVSTMWKSPTARKLSSHCSTSTALALPQQRLS